MKENFEVSQCGFFRENEKMVKVFDWINGDEGFNSTTTQKKSSNSNANCMRMNPQTPKENKQESIKSLLFEFNPKQINGILRFVHKNGT